MLVKINIEITTKHETMITKLRQQHGTKLVLNIIFTETENAISTSYNVTYIVITCWVAILHAGDTSCIVVIGLYTECVSTMRMRQLNNESYYIYKDEESLNACNQLPLYHVRFNFRNVAISINRSRPHCTVYHAVRRRSDTLSRPLGTNDVTNLYVMKRFAA